MSFTDSTLTFNYKIKINKEKICTIYRYLKQFYYNMNHPYKNFVFFFNMNNLYYF